MAGNIRSESSLPVEVKAVIWRIFGEGESPLKRRTTYELIESIVRNRVSSIDPSWVISEIRGWFESHEDRRWLKSEMSEPVAVLILEGVRSERGETAIWAVGSIEANLAASNIRSLWSSKEIDTFVEAALKTLERLCDQDEVLDVTRIARLDSTNAKIPKNAVEREGRLETFRHLDNHGFELVYGGLYSPVENLVDLVVELRPALFDSFIERLDHPVVRARAAYRMIAIVRPSDHRKTLQWIAKGSSDALIALTIVHTLNTVNKLDEELRFADRADADQYTWSTELRYPQDDLDTAAAGLITGLVARLAVLNPFACARWIGELLSGAPYMLHLRGEPEMPHRIKQLERACTELLVRLVLQSWSENLLAELRVGLCLTPRKTWPRHMAEIAWEIRDVEPERAAEIARVTLDEHEQYIAEQLKQNHLFLNWNDWHDREWFSGLSVALVLSCKDLDLPSWVSARCRALPLSVWDAEENHEAFSAADRAARHWFLVALHAIPALKELGRIIDPVTVRTLAETLWTHCHFVGQPLISHSEASVVAEHAARIAVEFGEPSDIWLLNQVRHPGVEPRALWALIDQGKLKSDREGKMDVHYDEMIATEFLRIASDRFSDGRQFDLEKLRYWGRLWLSLGAINEAELTAMTIIAFPLRKHDRVYKIMALKLLALVASKRKLEPTVADYPASLYGELWPGYTPSEEREDRRQIEEQIKRSKLPIL
ncbi:MAG: hypothetical protein OXL95_05095 [Nitrospira sp.]|nr:hypothetical protein [Nitrospira sp.]